MTLNTYRLAKLLARFSIFNLITQHLHHILHIKIHFKLPVARQIPTFVQLISQQQTINLNGSFWKQTLQTVVLMINTNVCYFIRVLYNVCYFILNEVSCFWRLEKIKIDFTHTLADLDFAVLWIAGSNGVISQSTKYCFILHQFNVL